MITIFNLKSLVIFFSLTIFDRSLSYSDECSLKFSILNTYIEHLYYPKYLHTSYKAIIWENKEYKDYDCKTIFRLPPSCCEHNLNTLCSRVHAEHLVQYHNLQCDHLTSLPEENVKFSTGFIKCHCGVVHVNGDKMGMVDYLMIWIWACWLLVLKI